MDAKQLMQISMEPEQEAVQIITPEGRCGRITGTKDIRTFTREVLAHGGKQFEYQGIAIHAWKFEDQDSWSILK